MKIVKNGLLLISLGFLLFGVAPHRAFAADFIITRITDNDVIDREPVVSLSHVAWHGSVGGDFEVFLHDGQTSTQLTDNEVWDGSHAISGSSVVWMEWDQTSNQRQVYLYDGRDVVLLSGDYPESSHSQPDISGGNVVWERRDYQLQESSLMLYDGITVDQIAAGPIYDPAVSGSNIVWESGSEIMFYDGSQTQTINGGPFFYMFPSISGSNVVWWGCHWGVPPEYDIDFSTCEIFYFDGSDVIQVTDDNRIDCPLCPDGLDISGSRVVWIGEDEWHQEQVFMWDVDTMNTTQLTNGSMRPKHAVVSGSNVAWSALDSEFKNQVFFYDGTSTAQVTDGNAHSAVVDISGPSVVFLRDWDILLARSCEATDSSPWCCASAPCKMEALIDLVLSYNLQHGIENSLDAKLESIANALEDVNNQNNQAAVNRLYAFINEVQAQRGQWLSDLQADELITAAQEIIALLTP